MNLIQKKEKNNITKNEKSMIAIILENNLQKFDKKIKEVYHSKKKRTSIYKYIEACWNDAHYESGICDRLVFSLKNEDEKNKRFLN